MRGVPWTRAELETLTREWHECCERVLRSKLPGRSWSAIRDKARLLGLPQGVPQGYESIAQACRRTGYRQGSLLAILEAAGVPTRILYREGACRGAAKRPRRYVEPQRVDVAIAAHLQLETVHGAARIRGVDDGALLRRLHEAGALGSRVERGRAYRLPSVVIDAALQGYKHRGARRAA